MGIEHRDYYREPSGRMHRTSGFWDMPIVCKRLMVATIIVFLAQILITRPSSVEDIRDSMTVVEEDLETMRSESPEQYEAYLQQMMSWRPQVSVLEEIGKLDPQQIAHGQVWRLVSYAFLHDRYSIWHLLINMLFLYWFGSRLEQMYGSTEFCLFYFASAIAAGIAFLALDYYTGSRASAIGASGAVWGLVALYVIHHPYERINIYFLFPVEIRWLALLYLIFDLHPVLLAINGERGFSGGVAHAAHLGGAAFGFAYFYRSWRLSPIWNRLSNRKSTATWQNRTVKRDPRSVVKFDRETLDENRSTGLERRLDPKAKRLEAELDQVLEKIQSEGRESLTDHEVQILERASRQYRDR